MPMLSPYVPRAAFIALALTFSSTACSKSKPDVQYGDPVSVRLQVGVGRPELEMALALAVGHGEPLPTSTADALVRIARACPEVDSLAKNGNVLRFRMKVREEVLHAAETPSDALTACAAKAVEGSPFTGKGPGEVDALAEIRAAASKDPTNKGAKE